MNNSRSNKKPNRTRSMRVFIRLSEDDKKEFEKRCAESGQTQSDYFRQMCLSSKPLRKRKAPHLNTELLLKYLGHIGKIGSNINQVAKETNGGFLPYTQRMEEIQKDVQHIRLIIREALGYDH